MRAVIYCRVSTKEQVQNLSLPTQLKACREYCAREGFDVGHEFTDAGESAKTIDRPEFQKLLQYCRDNKRQVRAVVVYNLTRFSRNAHDHAVVGALLLKLGIALRSVNEPIGDDSVGKLTANMLAAIAQFDNDTKADRTKAGMQAAIGMGRWTFVAPVGYLNNRFKGTSSLIPDPIRSPLVRQAFEEFATGRYTKIEVLRRVTALGLTSQKNKPLSAQSFNSLLRNPIYTGWVKVPSWKLSARGDFEALISEATFQRVQRFVNGSPEPTRGRAKSHPDFPLRRFVACGLCSTPLTGSWSKGRNQKYGYYHCRKCGGITTPKQKLDALFVELLSSLQPEAGYMRLFNAVVRDVWRGQQQDANRLRGRLEGVASDIRSRLDRIDDAFLHEQTIDRATYERQRDKFRVQLALAELELGEVVTNQLDVEGILGFAEHVLTDAARLWTGVAIEQKQLLQQALFPKGLTFDGEKFGTAVTCLAFRQLRQASEAESGVASPTGFEPVF